MLAIAVGILSLLNFPIGTAIGIYTLWVLTQPVAADTSPSTPTANINPHIHRKFTDASPMRLVWYAHVPAKLCSSAYSQFWK